MFRNPFEKNPINRNRLFECQMKGFLIRNHFFKLGTFSKKVPKLCPKTSVFTSRFRNRFLGTLLFMVLFSTRDHNLRTYFVNHMNHLFNKWSVPCTLRQVPGW